MLRFHRYPFASFIDVLSYYSLPLEKETVGVNGSSDLALSRDSDLLTTRCLIRLQNSVSRRRIALSTDCDIRKARHPSIVPLRAERDQASVVGSHSTQRVRPLSSAQLYCWIIGRYRSGRKAQWGALSTQSECE